MFNVVAWYSDQSVAHFISPTEERARRRADGLTLGTELTKLAILPITTERTWSALWETYLKVTHLEDLDPLLSGFRRRLEPRGDGRDYPIWCKDYRSHRRGDWLELPNCSGCYNSDLKAEYNHDAVYDYLFDEIGLQPHQITGYYGTYGLLVRLTDCNPEQLGQVQDVALTLITEGTFDDAGYAEFEAEQWQDAWDDYIYRDLCKDHPVLEVLTPNQAREWVQSFDSCPYWVEGSTFILYDETQAEITRRLRQAANSILPWAEDLGQEEPGNPEEFDTIIEHRLAVGHILYLLDQRNITRLDELKEALTPQLDEAARAVVAAINERPYLPTDQHVEDALDWLQECAK